MKPCLVLLCSLLFTNLSYSEEESRVAAVLDALHIAASKAEYDTYFDLFTEDAYFIGTDVSEYWPIEEFKSYAETPFSKGQGWTYTPLNRDIKLSESGETAWFHEVLDSKSYGTARGTGVLILEKDNKWRIVQYHLTFPIPNGVADEITDRIKAYEATLLPEVTHSPIDWVNTCTDWDDWDKSGPPFRIFGNSYYVGTCGITAILITGDEGHILIDGSTEAGADVIASNIEALGFSLSDVKLLLHSHEHFDHVAGLAKLQELSGARLFASPKAAPVLRTGIADKADPQSGLHEPFPPARVDGIINDGQTVKLGNLALNPIATPGHTPGALSWQWTSCESEKCLSIVYADSLSPISHDKYRFSDHLGYLESYRESLHKIARVECQLLISTHPSASKMRDRLSTPDGLVNPKGCVVYADNLTKRLDKRLLKEQKATE